MSLSSSDVSGLQLALPVKRPPLVGYAHHAYMLSIDTPVPGFEEWMAGEFIQLSCPRDLPVNREIHFDFYREAHYRDYEWLHIKKLNRDALEEANPDIVENVISQLDSGYYVILYVDEFEIKERVHYQQTHHVHEVMISGYDREASSFDTAGFNRRGLYSFGTSGFAEIAAGYERAAAYSDKARFFNAYLIRPKKIKPVCRLNQYELVRVLEDYVYAGNTFERRNRDRIAFLAETAGNDEETRQQIIEPYVARMNHAYGMDVYDYVQQYYENLISGKTDFDIRPVHIIWEHKVLMLERIVFFESKGLITKEDELSKRYETIKVQAEWIWKFMIKYQITRDPKLILRIVAYLSEMKTSERPLLELLMERLNSETLSKREDDLG